jgi:hypothetical protein
LAVLFVWETSATAPNKGYAQGRIDGTEARIQATRLGYPLECPILAACDTNTTAANLDAHVGYMQGFEETAGTMGIYGDYDILANTLGLWEIGWLPNAWSWSGTSRITFNAWGNPRQKVEDDMPIILTNSEPRDGFQPNVIKYAFDGITKRQLGAEYGPLFGVGAPYANPGVALSNAALNNIPNYAAPSGGSGTIPTLTLNAALIAGGVIQGTVKP